MCGEVSTLLQVQTRQALGFGKTIAFAIRSVDLYPSYISCLELGALSGIGIPFYMLWTGESVVLAHILCEVVA